MLTTSHPNTLSPLDLEQLDHDARAASALGRRALLWLGGLMLLVLASILWLLLLLQETETQDRLRQHTADAEWLDQTLRFQLRRLEADLSALHQRAHAPASQDRAGALLRADGVVAHQAWVPASALHQPAHWPDFAAQAAQQSPEVQTALLILLDTARGLQRPTYAGPWPLRDGRPTLWLAVPAFERGEHLGSRMAALPLEPLVSAAIPDWFRQDHALHLLLPDTGHTVALPAQDYVAPINLPGAALRLAVHPLTEPTASTPRLFFGAALLGLISLLVMLGFFWRDVLKRHRLEVQLQTQIALRSAMERSATVGLRAWDSRGQLLYVNQAFARMVGWEAEDLLVQAVPPYWLDPSTPELTALTQHLARDDAAGLGLETRLGHREGHEVDVLLHLAPLTSAQGTLVGWMGSALDITQRKSVERLAARQQEKLEASARLVAVGEVASTLAHELNQPLGALSSFANGLLNRLQGGRITLDDVTPVVDRMARIADKAGRVIQRVNQFARRQEMSRQSADLVTFVQRVASQLSLPEGMTLEMNSGDRPDHLMAPVDALLLEHAVHNVLLNAAEWAHRAHPDAGRIRVTLVTRDAMAGIRVEDDGPGIDASIAPNLFDAFASAKPGGMGMGLSICRSVVEAHHGHIEVASSPDLHGAQFTLWLPTNP